MKWHSKSASAWWLLVLTVALGLIPSSACRERPRPDAEVKIAVAGEPDRYSATVIRTVDDGEKRDVSVTREFRSAEMRREEWTEQGRNLALIWRPDLGSAFLLDLDARTYIEIKSNPGERASISASKEVVVSNQIEAVESAFDEAPSPESIENRALADDSIDGHPCSVYEERATFADGHTEITKSFRARDLSGLALRVETGPEPGTVKVITERRDVSTDVPGDAFTVPANYRKSEKPLL